MYSIHYSRRTKELFTYPRTNYPSGLSQPFAQKLPHPHALHLTFIDVVSLGYVYIFQFRVTYRLLPMFID